MEVFQADPDGMNLQMLEHANDRLRIRTTARTLAGMQKEAIIQYGPTGTVWRVISDEGSWLNGTDLAPFPLAFFTAGVAASLMSEFLAEARDRNIRVDSLNLVQDNFFTMEGSALRGTMAAGVQPMQVRISASGSASTTVFESIAHTAMHHRSAAECCLRKTLKSSFAVRANNEKLAWPGEPAETVAALADPEGLFADAQALVDDAPTLIRKIASENVSQGTAVGLAAEQKRVVHVRTEGSLREDGLKALRVQCIQPAGSCFEMLSDDSKSTGGQERAPDGLAYLSAGVAFCFMTQIGRYAQIVKQELDGYRIIQDTVFPLAQDLNPDAFAVETLVCLDTREPSDKSIQLVRMAEQTCYIHAAFRTAAASKLKTGSLPTIV